MSESEQLAASLQESILTVLCFVDDQANSIVGLLTPELFEPPYYQIAQRVLEFRQRYNKAPGDAHIDDLFDWVLEDPKNRQAEVYRRLLMGMMQQAKSLNVKYIIDRVTEFIRKQRLKAGVLEAAARYQQGGDGIVEDVERIMLKSLRDHVDSMEIGTRFSDTEKSLVFLDKENGDTFPTGITELDRFDLGPARGAMWMLLGSKGSGKSWSLISLGKQALLQRKNILHITLEMPERQVSQRYYQALFAVAKRSDEFKQTLFSFDTLGRLSGLKSVVRRPKLNLEDPNIRTLLTKKMDSWGLRLDNLIIKQFPAGALTVAKLNSYIESLEAAHHFIPDVILLDYPGLMKIDMENPRFSLGRLIVDLRGMAVERNLAMVAVAQVNRSGATSTKVTGAHVSEDWSQLMTADIVLTYSQTPDEKAIGLARLFVEKARGDKDGFTILVSQNYVTGQFALQSASMMGNYFDQLKEFVGHELAKEEAEE